jgi:uncharacterized damage-inducible protein DinB
MTDLLSDFFRQSEWATLRVIEVCRGLTDEQLDATAVGAFGSIRRTLVHLVGSDPSYVTRIGGQYDGPTIPRGPVWPGFDLLEEVVRQSTAGLIERAHVALEGSWTFESPEGETIDAEVVLVQALNHATEHRSQICTILTALGVEPPGLDGWAWAEATERIRMP